jgi:hypothetical protein
LIIFFINSCYWFFLFSRKILSLDVLLTSDRLFEVAFIGSVLRHDRLVLEIPLALFVMEVAFVRLLERDRLLLSGTFSFSELMTP